jgi:hypothetical protein
MDTSLGEMDRFSGEGWGWSNFWIGDPRFFTYTSPQINGYEVDPVTGKVSSFDISSDDTQFVIREAGGEVVYGPVGEGIVLESGVTSESVWELVGDPRSTVTPHDVADLGVPVFGAAPSLAGSTFGHPNRWNGGGEVQDFSVFAFSSAYNTYVTAAGLAGGYTLFDFDADGDGFINGQEFAHGTDPGDRSSAPQFLSTSGTSFGLTYLRRSGGMTSGDRYIVDGLEIEVEYSTNLVGWDPTSLQEPPPAGLPAPPAGYEYVTFLLPPAVLAGSDRAFLRVRVTGQ